MACSSDPKKVALWLARFRRLLDSGLTVARFCLVEGVSESSFYYWQKKLRLQALLGPRTQRRATRVKDCGTCGEDGGISAEDRGRSTHVEGRRRSTRAEDHSPDEDDGRSRAGNQDARSDDRDAGSEDRHIFTPVSVVPAAYGVVVRLPGGARIEVDAQHLDAIRAVVAETVRADHGQSAERNASTNNPAIRKASTNNPVVREESTGNQNIRRRGGTARTRHGAVSC